jgi:hypothetical protein
LSSSRSAEAGRDLPGRGASPEWADLDQRELAVWDLSGRRSPGWTADGCGWWLGRERLPAKAADGRDLGGREGAALEREDRCGAIWKFITTVMYVRIIYCS